LFTFLCPSRKRSCTIADQSRLTIVSLLLNALGDLSECVLNLLDMASQVEGVPFDEEKVEGQTLEVDAEREEDMLAYGCYIVECLTFKRKVDLRNKSVEAIRNKIVFSIMAFAHSL